MVITRFGLAALVALCGVAGAGGAYLATRSNPAPSSATLPAEPKQGSEVETSPPVRSGAATGVRERRELTVTDQADREPAAVPSPPAPRPPVPIGEDSASTPETATTTLSTPRESEPIRQVEEVVATAPEPEREELVVPGDAVLGLQMDSSVSSENARIEDQVTAHVTRDVRVGDRIAIPSGSKARGEVTFVERGGRLRERARLGVRFSSLLLSDGSRVPISTDVVFRDGDSPSRGSAVKIGGGAIGGAIIGGILGGGKGAVLGGTAGAGAGTALAMSGERSAATLVAGAPITVRLTHPVAVTVER